MRPLYPILFLLLAVASASAQDLLVTDVHIVDPRSGRVIEGSVLIKRGRVADIVSERPRGFTGTEFNGNGKWLVPGLNDMHVHSFGNVAPGNTMEILGTAAVAKLMLYSGVTGFLDLFSPEDQIFAIRDQQRTSGLPGADIYAAGPILTSTGGHGTEYGLPTRVIDSPADAKRHIDELAKKRPDVIKIVYDHAVTAMPTIDKATMEAAVKAAIKHEIKTVVHIGTWQDAREAVLAGANCITHTYGLADVPDDLVALMKSRGVYHNPTVAVQTELKNLVADLRRLDNPLLVRVAAKSTVDAYRDTAAYDSRTRGWLAWTLRSGASVMRSVKKMRDGGVKILAGTDAGNLGTFQGYSLHRELELLVEAGLTPREALASATTTAGEFLGQPIGIAKGDIANFLLLDASPLDDISNTQKIFAVIHRGHVVAREALLSGEAVATDDSGFGPAAIVWTRSLIDEFYGSGPGSAIGTSWSIDTDRSFGGSSTAVTEWKDGTLRVSGKLQPKQGMPALAGITLRFAETADAFDVTGYKGVRIRLLSASGPIALKLVTKGVTNYDYHAAIIPGKSEPQELELPFDRFRQLWSTRVPWRGTDMQAIAIWASAMGEAEYSFVVDRIELYR